MAIDRRGLNENNVRRTVDGANLAIPFDLGAENERLEGTNKKWELGVEYLLASFANVTLIDVKLNSERVPTNVYTIDVTIKDKAGTVLKTTDIVINFVGTKDLIPIFGAGDVLLTPFDVFVTVTDGGGATEIPDSDLDLVYQLLFTVLNHKNVDGTYLG